MRRITSVVVSLERLAPLQHRAPWDTRIASLRATVSMLRDRRPEATRNQQADAPEALWIHLCVEGHIGIARRDLC